MILRHTAAGSIVFLDRASLGAISMSELWERFVTGYQEMIERKARRRCDIWDEDRESVHS